MIEEIIGKACQEALEKLADKVIAEEAAIEKNTMEPEAIKEAKPTEGVLVIPKPDLIKPEIRDVKDCIDQLFEETF